MLVPVELRLADGLAHERERREVQDALDVPAREDRTQSITVADVGLDEGSALRNGRAMAPAEVVDDDHVVAILNQLLGDDAADVAGAAGDHELHEAGQSRRPLGVPSRHRTCTRADTHPSARAETRIGRSC